MKNIQIIPFLFLIPIINTTSAYAEHCSMKPEIKYDEMGFVTLPVSAGWAVGTRSMEYFNSAEDCFAEGLKWKNYIETDPSAAAVVSKVTITYGLEDHQIFKVFEVKSE